MSVTELPQVLRPFEAWEALRTPQAAAIACVTTETIRRWVNLHHIGRAIGRGHFYVSRVALAMHMEGDHAALADYLQGDREGPRVASYVENAKKIAAKTTRTTSATSVYSQVGFDDSHSQS